MFRFYPCVTSTVIYVLAECKYVAFLLLHSRSSQHRDLHLCKQPNVKTCTDCQATSTLIDPDWCLHGWLGEYQYLYHPSTLYFLRYIYICNYIDLLASIISVFLHNSKMLRKDIKLSLQNICHTMPHKTIICLYLFIIILDKKINQTLFGAHFVLKIIFFYFYCILLAFYFTISNNLYMYTKLWAIVG